MTGNFKFTHGDTTFKGHFNIYQAKNGAIMLLMGNKSIALTLGQVKELAIPCYNLEDFDHDDYNEYYILPIIKE